MFLFKTKSCFFQVGINHPGKREHFSFSFAREGGHVFRMYLINLHWELCVLFPKHILNVNVFFYGLLFYYLGSIMTIASTAIGDLHVMALRVEVVYWSLIGTGKRPELHGNTVVISFCLVPSPFEFPLCPREAIFLSLYYLWGFPFR